MQNDPVQQSGIQVQEEDTCQSQGKDKVLDSILKETPSKNKGSQFEGQSSGERTVQSGFWPNFPNCN